MDTGAADRTAHGIGSPSTRSPGPAAAAGPQCARRSADQPRDVGQLLPTVVRTAHDGHAQTPGAEVFFYANGHGSRVYFDEIGPPWPKHPCTDRVPALTYPLANPPRTAPPLYRPGKGRRLSKRADGFEYLSRYRQQRGTPPPEGWLVLEQHPYSYGAILHLSRPYDPTVVQGRTIPRLLPLTAGDLVFIKDSCLSYFDLDRFEVTTVRVSEPFPVRPAPRPKIRSWIRRR